MRTQVRTRFWIECALAVASGCLAVLTVVTREWIEIIFGVDPDGGSGALEWVIVAAFVMITLVSTILARIEQKRALAATGA